jgi:hypothetical protein
VLTSSIGKSGFLVVLAALLGFALGQGFGDPVEAGAFASAMATEGAVVGLSSESDDAALVMRTEADLMALLDQCTDPGSSFYLHEGERYMFVHGTTLVGPDEYSLLGVRSLSSAANSADLRAQAAALRYLKGITISAQAVDVEGTSVSSAGSVTGGTVEQVLTAAWQRTELQAIVTSSDGTLVGGRRIGQRIVVLSPDPITGKDQGLCVLVRWSFPLDQQSWSPTGANTPVPAAPTEAQSSPGSTDGQSNSGSGFTLPPPGVYGGF